MSRPSTSFLLLRSKDVDARDKPGHDEFQRRFLVRLSGMTACARLTLRANRLDIVAVGIDQERRIIGRAVVGPRAGAAIVAATGLDAVCVKSPDRRVIGRAERDVSACWSRPVVGIKPERRLALGPKASAGVIARAQYISERGERRRIETHAGVEILNL